MDQRLYALSVLLTAWITQILCLDFEARSCSHTGQESNNILLQYNVTFCDVPSKTCTSNFSNTVIYTLSNSTAEEPSIRKWERSLVGLCDGESRSLKIFNCQPLMSKIELNASEDAINTTTFDKCIFKILLISVFSPTTPPLTPMPTNITTPEPSKASKSNRRQNTAQNNDRQVLFYVQFIVIPIALVLLILIIYYLYKIEYANKNVKFYCVSEQFESAYEINQLI